MRKFCDIAFFGTFKLFFTWNKPLLLFTDALYCHKIITLKNNMNGILCSQLYCYQTVNEVSPFLAVDTCSLRIINLKGSFDHKLYYEEEYHVSKSLIPYTNQFAGSVLLKILKNFQVILNKHHQTVHPALLNQTHSPSNVPMLPLSPKNVLLTH